MLLSLRSAVGRVVGDAAATAAAASAAAASAAAAVVVAAAAAVFVAAALLVAVARGVAMSNSGDICITSSIEVTSVVVARQRSCVFCFEEPLGEWSLLDCERDGRVEENERGKGRGGRTTRTQRKAGDGVAEGQEEVEGEGGRGGRKRERGR